MKMIDLSVPLSPKVKEPTPPKIQYNNHEQGAEEAIHVFKQKGLELKKEDFHRGKA
ncbi:hypothetical protein MUN88_06815 [Gracilibacillus caseinilyticus]|uniref:Uncharacterized protein n=1 Tax=Gracilibacillus caseinilyticus TaxID=2932256 RepID=A0ABY4F0S0_9BACI|nr:hypothetical protein [Gracilibacillus caseinilyticus]UOQ49782.1 hypothetical protein MUN88_06815 [Gracilibacillus caseinilyticus]